jgi:hypothetical protein
MVLPHSANMGSSNGNAPLERGVEMLEFTTTEAVRAYGVHPNVLGRLILTGRLQARKNPDGRWLISKESLDCWNAQRVRRAPKPAHGTVSKLAAVHA